MFSSDVSVEALSKVLSSEGMRSLDTFAFSEVSWSDSGGLLSFLWRNFLGEGPGMGSGPILSPCAGFCFCRAGSSLPDESLALLLSPCPGLGLCRSGPSLSDESSDRSLLDAGPVSRARAFGPVPLGSLCWAASLVFFGCLSGGTLQGAVV